MLYYPKMPGGRGAGPGRCVAFEKLDGTNLHWDWDRTFGWHRFGTRRDQYELTPAGVEAFAARHAHLADAPAVFERTLAGPLADVLRGRPEYAGFDAVRAFTEFVGPNSFAGLHRAGEPKRTVLIDVWPEGYGFVGPAAFVEHFGHLPTPRVVYRGPFTGRFADDVRAGRYGVAEGVVCKGGTGGPEVWMAKVKTDAYMRRLKAAFADRWEEYWE
jgi:hypothetical protein